MITATIEIENKKAQNTDILIMQLIAAGHVKSISYNAPNIGQMALMDKNLSKAQKKFISDIDRGN